MGRSPFNNEILKVGGTSRQPALEQGHRGGKQRQWEVPLGPGPHSQCENSIWNITESPGWSVDFTLGSGQPLGVRGRRVVWLEVSCRNTVCEETAPAAGRPLDRLAVIPQTWRDEDPSQSRGSRDGEKKDMGEQNAWPARGKEREAEVKRGVITWESRCKKCFQRQEVRPQAPGAGIPLPSQLSKD